MSNSIAVWNTGRLYTAVGQVIAAVEVDGGVIFNDVSRMIDGYVVATPERIERDGVQRVAMWGYDTGAPTEGGGYKYNYQHVPSELRDVLSELHKAACAYIANDSGPLLSSSTNGISVTSVETVSGSAGGSSSEADVVLRVKGVADTVVGVRKYVERACKHHDVLVAALVEAQELLEERCPAAELNQKGAAKIVALLKRVQS